MRVRVCQLGAAGRRFGDEGKLGSGSGRQPVVGLVMRVSLGSYRGHGAVPVAVVVGYSGCGRCGGWPR